MASQPETRLRTRIVKRLKREFGSKIRIIKIWGGYFQEAGVSDLLCCVYGIFFAFEVKRKGGKKPTDLQINFIDEINEAEGYGKVIYSPEDALKLIHKVLICSISKEIKKPNKIRTKYREIFSSKNERSKKKRSGLYKGRKVSSDNDR